MSASHIQQKYFIKVRLPEAYDETHLDYPVLYLLDGDHAFAMATDIVQYLIYGQYIPDLIIVSTAYGCKDIPEHGGTNMRGRDFAPYPTPYSSQPPGASNYLQFLQEELMPFIAGCYRVDEADRTLAGFSGGALFALYVLFQEPRLFRRLIACDYSHDRILAMEASFAETSDALPVTLFLGSGDEDLSRLAETMCARGYSGLNLIHDQLSPLGHFAIPAEGLAKGLVAVFQDQMLLDGA